MRESQSLQSAFERVAATAPGRIAWIEPDGTASGYRDVARAAGRVAGRLRGNEDRIVGLLLERGVDMAVGMLGALKAGAAFLPLGLEEPPARLERILADARPSAVLVHGATRGRLHTNTPLIDLDALAEDEDEDEGEAVSAPGEAAYVIYTSGSAGVPKGVVVEHENLFGHLDWLRAELPLRPGDRLLQVAPYTFDASLTDFFWPLSSGATVVSLDEGDHLDPYVLATALARRHVTAVRLPPAIMPLLLDEPVLREATSLRYLICGGDRLPSALAARILDVLPHVRLFNRYGPTETAVAVTYHEVDPRADLDGADVPIGRAVGGAELWLADEVTGRCTAPAPGASGELLVAGRPVARGYLGDDDLTGERFVAMPDGGRAFRTGDLVSVNEAGALVFEGRRDAQLQVAGNRVEPGEIRTHLNAFPGVADSAITLRGEALAAYIVPTGAPPDSAAIRAHLAERLPRHMLPAHLVFLDRMPLTERGKVDLAALPDPTPETRDTLATSDASPTAAAWREVIGVADPARGFLESGGTSLKAAMLANRVRARTGAVVTVADVLRAPTLHDFEAAVDERLAGRGPGATRLAARPPGTEPPLSHLQERLWFLHEYAPDEPVYNFQAIFKFTGALDEAALRRALAGIIERHEILRTSFTAVDGEPRQTVHPAAPPALTVIDLREAEPDPARAEDAAQRFADEFVRRSFRIDVPPLIRWCLIRLDGERTWLVQSQHHLVHDGWSFSVFLRELVERYRAALAGTRPKLPEPLVQCGDFAYWQRRWWERDGAREHLPYWLDRLNGVPPLALTPRPDARGDHSGHQVRRRIPPELVAAVRRTAADLDVTPFMLCFAAWTAFLRGLTGQRDFAVGTAVANRPWVEAEHMLGCVLNNIPVRVRPEPGAEFRELAADTRRLLLEGYAHQAAPLHAIVEALRVPRTMENPLFQTTFNFHDAPYPDLTLPGVELVLAEAVPNGTSKFPLDVIVITEAQRRTGGPAARRPEEWDMVWHASARHFDAAEAAEAADGFLRVLARACADPALRLAELGDVREPVASAEPEPLPSGALPSEPLLVAVPEPPAEPEREPEPAFADESGGGGMSDAAERARAVAVIRAVWAELLRLPHVAEDDNFFERGGHSLLAVRAISLIRTRLDRHVPVRAIFEAQTAGGLADAVTGRADAKAEARDAKAEARS